MQVYVTCLLLLSGAIYFCSAQTFQYSRGWTNGKRSEINSNPSQSLVPDKADKYNNLMQHLLRSPCELRIAAALAANRNRDIYRGANELLGSGDAPSVPFIIDAADEDNRFKRQIPVRSDS